MATIEIDAARYADYDDSLAVAAEEYAAEQGLEDWQVTAEWDGGEDGERDWILLTVPEVVS